VRSALLGGRGEGGGGGGGYGVEWVYFAVYGAYLVSRDPEKGRFEPDLGVVGWIRLPLMRV
jgi:hypothetical protein